MTRARHKLDVRPGAVARRIVLHYLDNLEGFGIRDWTGHENRLASAIARALRQAEAAGQLLRAVSANGHGRCRCKECRRAAGGES